MDKLKGKIWHGLIITLVALPGIISIIQLHPLEYIYFNSFGGGVQGAFREYELDYWLTSYREAAEILNSQAPEGATAGVYLEFDGIKDFLRDDLTKIFIRGENPGNVDFVIITTNLNYDQELEALFPNLRQIGQVERFGIPITVIYEVLKE